MVWIPRQKKLRMASFIDTEGSVVKEINIQRKSINGSQVSAVLVLSYKFASRFYLCHFVIHFHLCRQ